MLDNIVQVILDGVPHIYTFKVCDMCKHNTPPQCDDPLISRKSQIRFN
jgi:hypothetical protein